MSAEVSSTMQVGVCRGKQYNSDTRTGREKLDFDSSRTQAVVN